MAYRKIKFSSPVEFESLGRNGYIKTTGVDISTIGENDVWFEPINSKGNVSDSARVVVSVSDLDQIIKFLTDIRNGHLATYAQAEVLANWLEANRKVTGWLHGYPLGAAYIRPSEVKGAKRDGRQAYVDLDKEAARQVPQFAGKDHNEIREFLIENFPDLIKETAA
jgi:hypothetical protein